MRLNYNFAFKNSKLTPWERPAPPNLLISNATLKKKVFYIISQLQLNKDLFYPSLLIIFLTIGLQILNIFPTRSIKKLESDHMQYQIATQKFSTLSASKNRFNQNIQNIDKYFSQATTSYLFAFYLQNSVPKGVQINSYSFNDNGFDINATAYNLDSFSEFITLIIESPVIIKESVSVNQLNRKETGQSSSAAIVPDFEIDIYGKIKKLDMKKREDLYLESKANGLLRKLERFNTLKQKLGS